MQSSFVTSINLSSLYIPVASITYIFTTAVSPLGFPQFIDELPNIAENL